MIAKKVTRYYSECGKGFWKKQPAINHESNCKCWNNPKNRTCKTCEHGDYAPYEPDTGYGGFWGCNNPNIDFSEHTGGPPDVDYISVKCAFHSIAK